MNCRCPRDGSRLCEECQHYLNLAEGRTATATLPPVTVLEEPVHNPFWPYRSKTEYLYAVLLEQWQGSGLCLRWRYEAMRLTLATLTTTLTVDFMLTMPPGVGDGRIQLHETKGKWYREDGWIKLKQAAVLYPEFRMFLVQRKDSQWTWKEVPSA